MSGRDEQMAELMEEIEVELVLQGSTAIEDKLQDGVSDTLSSLRAGSILVWMLTGDKVDTAINIGFSCSLLTTDMELLRLVADDGDMALDEERVPVQDAIENAFTQLLSGRTHQERALVVDTGALAAVIKFGLEARMLELCGMCKSVICARVSPKQKAKVVEMVRRARPAMVTLAYLWFSIIAVTVVVTGLSLTIHGFVSVMRPPSSLVAREIEKIEKKGLDGVKSRDL